MKKLIMGFTVVLVLAGTFALAFPTMLHKAGLHPEYHGPRVALQNKRALVITTSHDVLAAPGETEGPATGVVWFCSISQQGSSTRAYSLAILV